MDEGIGRRERGRCSVMWTLRLGFVWTIRFGRHPKSHALATAEFATLRLRLLKLGARIIETVSRVRLAFAAACPQAELFRTIAIALHPAEP
jgi:hypothetical protein